MLDEQKAAFEGMDNLINKLISYGQLLDNEEEQAQTYLFILEQSFDTEYIQYLKAFNEITGQKYGGGQESRALFYGNNVHTLQDKIKAVKNANENQFMLDNKHLLTPKFLLKKENVSKFMNNNSSQTQNPVNDGNNSYTEVQNI